MKIFIGSFLIVATTAGVALAAVNVDVSTPNARVQVGTPMAAPPQQIRVIEHERIIIKEKESGYAHDNGKHKGQKKHKKHKKHGK